MPLLMLKNLPRYECLLEAAQQFADLDPSASEAYLHLLRAADEVYHAREAYLSSHGLSQGRFTVLMLLLDKTENCPSPHTPAELADLAGVTRATMTGLIDTLERDGLVKRVPDPVDRRMMSVHLTARGQEVLRRVLPGHFRRTAAMLAPLSESERKTLVRLSNKIAGEAARLRQAK
jgi:DNA-binding MarR family transcriptional regulator